MQPLNASEKQQLESFVQKRSVFPDLPDNQLTGDFGHDTAVAGEYFFCERHGRLSDLPVEPYDRFCTISGAVRGTDGFERFVARVIRPEFGLLSAATWHRNYGRARTAMKGLTFDQFKADLESRLTDPGTGQTKSMSAFGGKRRQPRVEKGELEKIYPDWASKADEAKKQRDLDLVNEAFKLLQLDTVQAQAIYLAHASGESGQFLDLVARGDDPAVVGKFLGRGPLQVTTQVNFVASLAFLQLRAEELVAAGDAQNAAAVAEAYYAISQDVAAASDPRYAFLFSAAFMRAALHARQEEQAIQSIQGTPGFGGTGVESRFETGGRAGLVDPNAANKSAAYRRAIRVLS